MQYVMIKVSFLMRKG